MNLVGAPYGIIPSEHYYTFRPTPLDACMGNATRHRGKKVL